MPNHLMRISIKNDQFPTREFYPFALPVLNQTESIEFNRPVTLFAGDNGTGKSTLLEAIAVACGIHIWRSETTRYRFNEYEAMLHKFIKVEWRESKVIGSFFGSQFFKDFTHIFEQWAATDPGLFEYFGGKSLITQSHGQSLMSFFRNRYKIKGLYLLDEPETALSPKSQLELLQIIEENTRTRLAQFIIATHSPILLACPKSTIYSFDTIPVSPIKYEETDHYKIYRDFMADRSKYLLSNQS